MTRRYVVERRGAELVVYDRHEQRVVGEGAHVRWPSAQGQMTRFKNWLECEDQEELHHAEIRPIELRRRAGADYAVLD